MTIHKDAIKDKSLDILEQEGIYEPVVNAVEIANRNGIQVKEIDMPAGYSDVAGFYNEREKTIYISKSDKPNRKLFTVAHELGHVFLNHQNYDVLFRIPRKDATYTQSEKEANIFAAELLMPEFMLKEYLERYDISRGDYKKMADIFGVPVESMKYQLAYLKD